MSPLDFISKYSDIIWLLGYSDIKVRYARTTIGQWWITLSQAIFISAIGLVWAKLWGVPLQKYLPSLAMGTTFWAFLTGMIGRSPLIYVGYRSYILDKPHPKLIYVLSAMLNNSVVFGHNFVFTLLVLVIFADLGVNPVHQIVSILTIFATLGWVFLLSLVFAVLGAKFRDLNNIVGSLLNVSFFVSPVMWSLDRLTLDNQFIAIWVNPFVSSLTAFRNIFVQSTELIVLLNGLTSDLILMAIIYVFYVKFAQKNERKVEFWIL